MSGEKKPVTMRVDADLLAWAGEYAEVRGATRTAIVESALEHYRELVKGGVPELPEESGGVHVVGHMGGQPMSLADLERKASEIRARGGKQEGIPRGALGPRAAAFLRATQGAGKPMEYGTGRAPGEKREPRKR